MKKATDAKNEDDLRPEYDFSQMEGGVRGKHFESYQAGTNLVHLAPDVAEVFRDEQSVNEALRSLIKIARSQAQHAH